MAAEWIRKVFHCRASVFLLVTGAALGITAYVVYRRKKSPRNKEESSQESEQSGAGEEAEQRIVVLGLDGAGKTSLLSFMSKQEIVQQPVPTDGFNVMCIHNEHKAVNIWEVGGSENIRAYWKNFLQGTNTLVFVIDASDHSRLTEAGMALQNILQEDKLRSVPLIIVANKQDLPGAVPSGEMMEKLAIQGDILQQHPVTVLDAQVPPNGDVKSVENVKTALLSITH